MSDDDNDNHNERMFIATFCGEFLSKSDTAKPSGSSITAHHSKNPWQTKQDKNEMAI